VRNVAAKIKWRMQIETICLYRASLELREPFVISLGSITHADNIFIRITTSEGITGYGECSPSLTINGESVETCFAAGRYIARSLKGADPLDIGKCSAIADSVIYGNTSIKSAFDIALHDIASRHANVPLYTFLGGSDDREIYTDYTVSLDSAERMADNAGKIKHRGFPFIKVKLGDNRENDVERVLRIRKKVGEDIPLRLDANQGWDKDTAISILNDLAGMNIQYCEEPIPRWDFMSLPEVRRSCPIPLMADESCLDHHDAERLIKLGACDYINIKLGKSSGLYKGLKIAGVAGRAGVKMMVGGFMETRLAFTASAHLFLSSRHIVFSDFDSPLMMKEDPVEGGISYGIGGRVNVPGTAGLGAIIRKEFLESLPSEVVI
jgi:L-Ala-D/L-Glu epimerase